MWFLIVLGVVWLLGALIFGLATQDEEMSWGWLLIGLLPMFLSTVIIGTVSSSDDWDSCTVTLEDVRMPITQMDEQLPNQIKILPNGETGAFDLLLPEKDGGLNLFVKPLRVSASGNELYVRKLVKKRPASFWRFGEKLERWFLVLPESILK